MRKYFIKIGLIIFIFFMLYYPPVFSINWIFITSIVAILLLFILKTRGSKIYIPKTIIKFIVFLILEVLVQTIITLICGYSIISSIKVFIYFIALIPSLLLILNICIKEDIRTNRLINLILIVSLIQSFLSVIAYLNIDFQNWFVEEMIEYGYGDTRFSQLAAFRLYGVATQLSFTTPIVQTFLSLITIFLGLIISKKYYIFSPFLLFSAIINARISIIMFGVGLFIMLIYIMFSEFKDNYLKRFFKVILMTFATLILILLLMSIISYDNFKWLVNGTLNAFGINVDTSATYPIGDYFFNMKQYLLPNGVNLFIGTGSITGTPDIAYSTDIGYVNNIWKYGLFGTIILYSVLLKFIYNVKKIEFHKIKIGFFLCFELIAFLLITNIKGDIISMNTFMVLLFILIFVIPFTNMASKNSYYEFNKIERGDRHD